jgi:putative ABC transport system permease protein
MTLFLGSLQLGLIYGLLALGIYITFKIMHIPDLTADGSFTLGLAVSAVLASAGYPVVGIFLAVLAGALAGATTGFLQTKIAIHPILSGIITMSGLYSINLYVMGARSNITLIGTPTLFSMARSRFDFVDFNLLRLVILLFFALGLWGALTWFFKTHLGLSIRATGDNEAMVKSSSINITATKIIAISLANACIALSGAIVAQYQGFADISSGVGIMVIGLASVIIGELIPLRKGVANGFLTAILGSILYRLMIALALQSNLFPAYALKLISALIVGIALSLPALRHYLAFRKIRKESV